jgi:hypothetical protein
MKTHAHYTIPTATAPWMRRNLAALAALLALMVTLVGLAFALGRFGQVTPSTMWDSAASPARLPGAACGRADRPAASDRQTGSAGWMEDNDATNHTAAGTRKLRPSAALH